MSVNSLIKAALDPVAPVEADTYEDTAATYITFGYVSSPADFGDDEPDHEIFSISVHLFAPTGEDTIAKRRAIKKALAAAGTTWPIYSLFLWEYQVVYRLFPYQKGAHSISRPPPRRSSIV